MDIGELLSDGIARSQEVLFEALKDISTDELNTRPGDSGNSIAWLAWHAARQQDAQVAALAGTEEIWTSEGWAERFGLDLPADSMGYGHTPQDAAKVIVDDPALLRGYLEAATKTTQAYMRSVTEADLDEIIDRQWDPPVTRGVRLISIIDDSAQHAGQAAYVRGLLDTIAKAG